MPAPVLPSSLSLVDYSLYDDATQMERKIDRYPLSFTRTPNEPLIARPLTRSERTGPTDLDHLLRCHRCNTANVLRSPSRSA